MSTDAILHNQLSNADFLAVALGAKKARRLLKITTASDYPFTQRHHKFSSGRQTCPKGIQKLGFEWLWRIVQEPKLWKPDIGTTGTLFHYS